MEHTPLLADRTIETFGYGDGERNRSKLLQPIENTLCINLIRTSFRHSTSTVLRGHTHRPWRATFCRTSKMLVTVGEVSRATPHSLPWDTIADQYCLQDLRCLVWNVASVSSSAPIAPVAQHRGHEGKNIWSVAVAESLALIVSSPCVILQSGLSTDSPVV